MKKFISIVTLLSSFLVMAKAEAAVPGTWAAYNVPSMTLAVRISEVQTTGITVNPPVRNGDSVSVPFTASGGVVEIKQPGKVEHIYFSKATVNASTKRWTMTGTVIRDIPWNSATSFTTAGDGQIFTPGATVTFVDDSRMFNLSVYTDRSNTFTSKGSIKFSGSGSMQIPSFSTTAERDQQNPCNAASGALKAYVTATSVEYLCSGGSWVQASSGSTVNSGYGNSGKVQGATPTQIAASTGTGSSGAPLVPFVKDIVTSSNGLGTNTGRLVALSGGLLDPSVLGIGVSSGFLLQVQSRGEAKWVAQTSAFPYRHEATVTTASANVGTSSTATGTLAPVWTGTGADAGSLPIGSVIHIKAGGQYNTGAGVGFILLYAQDVLAAVFRFDTAPTNAASPWYVDATLTVRAVGAAGSIIASGTSSFAINSSNEDQVSTAHKYGSGYPAPTAITVDTTAQIPITFKVRFDTSNGSNLVNIQTGTIATSHP